MLLTNLGAVEGIIFCIEESWKNWTRTRGSKCKNSKVLERGSTRLAHYIKSNMHHACMVTWPITWLVTWYDEITPESVLIGYMMVTRHGDMTSLWIRSAVQSTSFTPNFRPCGRLLIIRTSLSSWRHSAKVNFDPKFSICKKVLILQRLKKFTSPKKKF